MMGYIQRLLVDELAVERNAQRRQQQPGVPIRARRGPDGNVAAGDQLGRIRVVVDLNLGKVGDNLWREAEADVATAVTAAALDTLPILDPRHDDINTL